MRSMLRVFAGLGFCVVVAISGARAAEEEAPAEGAAEASAETSAEAPAPVDTNKERQAMTQSAQAKKAELLEAPAGVFDPIYENGKLKRIFIKGESEVSSSMKASLAERLAREKAMRDAKAQFLKWLKEEAKTQESEKEGFIITIQGKDETAEGKQELNKSFESTAQGVLRGMIVLMDHVSGEGDNRKSIVVYGWSKKLADAARTAQSEMAKEPEAEKAAGSSAAKSGEGKDKAEGPSDTKTRTAKNLDDF